jgi:hypothetical protein
MKFRPTQFGEREHTASSRQHAPGVQRMLLEARRESLTLEFLEQEARY